MTGKPFTDNAGFERLKAIGRPEREARRYRRALETVVRLHGEAEGMLFQIRADAFDAAAERAAEALTESERESNDR